jgi:hypothetical protein
VPLSNITARYLKVTVFGNGGVSPPATQARELQVYGASP